ncbi:ferritin light chain-like isoform X2 [Panulirus ornatus]
MEKSTDMKSLMKMFLDDSLTYLLTSQQFGSQYMQRPGMAKLLSKASDKNWEKGLDLLKKMLQRGGTIDKIFPTGFSLSGTGYLSVGDDCFPPADVGQSYIKTFKGLLKSSLDLFTQMNSIHINAVSVLNSVDAEIAHYLDEKLEDEAKNIREMKGHIITLGKMASYGVAVDIFDSNL